MYSQKKKEDELDGKRRKEGVNLVIPFVPSADNSNLSADGDDSFISVDSAMPSPFSEVSLLPHAAPQQWDCTLTGGGGGGDMVLDRAHFQPVEKGCIRMG